MFRTISEKLAQAVRAFLPSASRRQSPCRRARLAVEGLEESWLLAHNLLFVGG
jgi:hypothetical protein